MRLLGLVFLSASVAAAGEYALLASGSRLHIERHEADGAKVRLYHGGGTIEMDAALVKAFEDDGLPPPAIAVLTSTPAPAPVLESKEPPKLLTPMELADSAADKYGLPRSLVRSVMAAESAGRAAALSNKGAIGLMQLMPGTAQELGVDPWDPAQNVDGGARYLRLLIDKYDGRLWHVLAAYNAGPGAVDRYRGVPPYRETINYINYISSLKQKLEQQGN